MKKIIIKPEVILFDCFETLVKNEITIWHELFNNLVLEHQLRIDALELWGLWKKEEINFRNIRNNLSNLNQNPPFITYKQAWQNCFDKVFAKLGNKNISQKCAESSIKSMASNEPYEDSEEMIINLSKYSKIGIISNADNNFLIPVLNKINFKFDFILSSEDAECYKPNPKIFEIFLEKYNINAQNCWYVGDKEFDDVIGSSSVGMQPILINRNIYNDTYKNEKYIGISNLKQLYEEVIINES
ncbi:MAG: HAD family hydrolase [Dehalococcoidia bacterium]|nr:HAD family hydrolase [Dehalococcoidia bacterium]